MIVPLTVKPGAGASIDTFGGTVFDRLARPRIPSAEAAGSAATIVASRKMKNA
jgi:hypothetical protein